MDILDADGFAALDFFKPFFDGDIFRFREPVILNIFHQFLRQPFPIIQRQRGNGLPQAFHRYSRFHAKSSIETSLQIYEKVRSKHQACTFFSSLSNIFAIFV
ncbi:MAG: hypothetical protein K2O46_07495, partial [Bacteroidales bacterium]|nr:hypothetical protein [Bacteroidales bacterium]